jgi:hypothetical protein
MTVISQADRFEAFIRDLDLVADLPGDMPWSKTREILISRKRVIGAWTDPQARLGGVVAAGSRCACQVKDAETVLNSPMWGAWDVCRPCGTEQLYILHGGDIGNVMRPDLVSAMAQRTNQLNQMLCLPDALCRDAEHCDRDPRKMHIDH